MIKRKCLVCKKIFEIHPYRIKTARYCSPKCLHKDMKGKCFNTGRTHFKKGQPPTESSFKKGNLIGTQTRFKKGQKVWNKGTKGVMKPNKTSFKSGKEHPMFKEITYHQGYVFIKAPNHPFARRHKTIKRCRYIVEKHIKRFLQRYEKVHHLNNIRDDDRLENLMAFINQSAHRYFHVNPNNVKPPEIIFDGRKM